MPGPAVLSGERVTLRTVERDDAEFLQRASAEPEIRIPLGNSQPDNENQAEESIEEYVGYGTESLALFVDYLFESFPTHRLHVRAFESNRASRGVARKLGFTEEGSFREARFVRGEYVDVYHYGLLRREWEELRPIAERTGQ